MSHHQFIILCATYTHKQQYSNTLHLHSVCIRQTTIRQSRFVFWFGFFLICALKPGMAYYRLIRVRPLEWTFRTGYIDPLNHVESNWYGARPILLRKHSTSHHHLLEHLLYFRPVSSRLIWHLAFYGSVQYLSFVFFLGGSFDANDIEHLNKQHKLKLYRWDLRYEVLPTSWFFWLVCLAWITDGRVSNLRQKDAILLYSKLFAHRLPNAWTNS